MFSLWVHLSVRLCLYCPNVYLYYLSIWVVCDAAAAWSDEENWRPDVEANWGDALPEEPPQGMSSGLKSWINIYISHHIGYVPYKYTVNLDSLNYLGV